eukprot:10338803-Alexandrium_andersonii.AAC.1
MDSDREWRLRQNWDGGLEKVRKAATDGKVSRFSEEDPWSSHWDTCGLCITMPMVQKVLKAAAKKKAPGVDELPYEVLQALPREIWDSIL